MKYDGMQFFFTYFISFTFFKKFILFYLKKPFHQSHGLDVSVVVFLKKSKDEKWRTRACHSQSPIWNENFCLPLLPDAVTKGIAVDDAMGIVERLEIGGGEKVISLAYVMNFLYLLRFTNFLPSFLSFVFFSCFFFFLPTC
jgi:hypothetical protein